MLAKRTIPENRDNRERLREIIRTQSLLKDRDFQLSSGRRSNYYFDMKKTTLDPEGGSWLRITCSTWCVGRAPARQTPCGKNC